MSASPKIAILGAGLGGLAAALALLRRGFDVDVYEQAPVLGEVGAGIQISANGMRVLFDLGLKEPIMANSFQPQGKEIRLWNTGQTWKLFDLGLESVGRYGFPYVTTHRADLHKALADGVLAAKPGAIHLDARCTGVRQDDDGVTLRFGDREVRADLMIGADGIHSLVRETLFGLDKPKFNGIVAWRGVVPMASLPEHLHKPVGTNWVGPGGHVIHYPVRRGELMNFVSFVERDDWQVESWSVVGTREECHADYEGWHADIHAIIDAIDKPYKWALASRPPLEQWTVGRITLLGDACHPTLPTLAQGAVMALEDGLVLARALEAHGGDHRTGFAGYEGARKERTSKIVRGSADNAKRFHEKRLVDPDFAEGFVTAEWAEDKIRERYEWLFTYDATSVPV